jgi:chromosome segregation ATPase
VIAEKAHRLARKALEYAENVLGVHDVWRDALQARNELDEALTPLSEARDKRRELEFLLQDAEMEVASEEWGKHSDMAVTRMEKHLKIAIQNNDRCRELREQIAKVQGDIDGFESDVEVAKASVRIASARLTELGGYLQYLAAIKLTQPQKPEDPETPRIYPGQPD